MLWAVLGAICAVVAVVAFIGWVLAHVRPAPAEVRDELGPVGRSFPVPTGQLRAGLGTAVEAMRGVQLSRSSDEELICAVRPRLNRLDDAMGLFVRIRVQPAEAGSRYRITGMCRSSVGLASSSERALVGFERDLRSALRSRAGIQPDLFIND